MKVKETSEQTALAVMKDVQLATTPPLKKAELIEALAVRKREKMTAEAEVAQAAYKKTSSDFNEQFAAWAKKLVTDGKHAPRYRHETHGGFNGVPSYIGLVTIEISVSLQDVPAAVTSAHERMKEAYKKYLPLSVIPPVAELKKQVKAIIEAKNNNRVAALLGDEDAVKVIDKALEALESEVGK